MPCCQATVYFFLVDFSWNAKVLSFWFLYCLSLLLCSDAMQTFLNLLKSVENWRGYFFLFSPNYIQPHLTSTSKDVDLLNFWVPYWWG